MDVFSTAFLPGIGYFRKWVAASDPVIDWGEHFIKQTQRNRASILSSGGPQNLIIPLRKSGSKRVGDMEISYTEDWQTRCLRAIRSSYKNSPYFEHYQPEFEELLLQKEPLLAVYNQSLFSWLLKELDIPTPASYSDIYIETGALNDYRNTDFYTQTGVDVKPYKQVFSYKMDFQAGLSAIDLLFNKGPEAFPYFL